MDAPIVEQAINYAQYTAKRAELAQLLAEVEAKRLGPVTPQIDLLLLSS